MKRQPTDKRQRYAIKKLTIGVVSVATGASILLYSPQVLAEEANQDQTTELTTSETASKNQANETLATSQPSTTPETVNTDAVSEKTADNATVGTEIAETETLHVSSEQTTTPSTTEEVSTQAVPSNSTVETKTEDKEATEKAGEDKQEAVSQTNTTATTEMADPVQETTVETPKIEDGYFRLHFKSLPSQQSLESLGLWLWDDVDSPSANWPDGAMPLAQAKKDDYGYYIDFKLSQNQKKQVSYLINNKAGDNLTGDQHISLLTPEMNEAWADDSYHIHTYQPLENGSIRLNYYSSTGNYDNLAAWLFKDVKTPSTDWPNGQDFIKKGAYGVYIDIPLSENAKELGFLILDKSKSGDDVKIQPNDYVFKDLANHTQIFVRDTDPKVYNNPYYIDQVRLTGAEQSDLDSIQATFTTLDGMTKDDILKALHVLDKDGKEVTITDITLTKDSPILLIKGDFHPDKTSYTLTYNDSSQQVRNSWELKDKLYAYDGELGARLSEDGSQVSLALWAPSAEQVKVIIYDKNDQSKLIGEASLTKGDKGVWTARLDEKTPLGIANYTGYYYLYEITRNNEKVLVLDPYAKSLAAWDSSRANDTIKTAKAAFVNPDKLGLSDLDFAHIDNFTRREQAVIYETHVRDFTSDPALDGTFNHSFGTFSAFIEKLDYLKELGVTHIQLLPVLSYFFVNELDKTRSENYTSADNNYNWGYDPQHYFSLSGMYSENPNDPELRISEFKNLVNEIHKRGMGVILDVVYNHTAKTYLFEDIEPNYYHFMNADGTARESFGGGRLGTTHYMSHRLLLDSIKYLTSEFKVDGFRFDMMGDHDAAVIDQAFTEAKAINPNILMLGEGWRTYQGDEGKKVQAADQDWMSATDTVAVFSDDIRNTLKSGYPNEGTPAFITGGKKSIKELFSTIKAQPNNFTADDPGDVIQYIAAHDNLTLHDVIAKSINKDPKVAEAEIHQRIRLGNALILTSQGTPFIHAGQEYGRTKQLLNPNYITKVADDKVPNKATLIDAVKEYPYFIHDSYDSSDAVNHFDWESATNSTTHPINTTTQAYTKGLIALRRSTDAFTKASKAEVNRDVSLITDPALGDVAADDLLIGYQSIASNGDIYAVFVNADQNQRTIHLPQAYRHLLGAQVLADSKTAGTRPIAQPYGITFGEDSLAINGLTAIILKVPKEKSDSTEEKDTNETATDLGTTSSKPSHILLATSNSTQSQQVVNKETPVLENKQTTANKAQQALLPNTGSKSSNILTLLGASLLALATSLLGFGKSRKH